MDMKLAQLTHSLRGKGLHHVYMSEPIGCHIQAIDNVGKCFDTKEGAAEFDSLLKPRHHRGGHFGGEFFTGTIVSVRQDQFNTIKELENREFVLLGTLPGAHGDYKMVLYGKGFTLPERK